MYKPTRSKNFEYIWDLMSFIEDNQCRNCAFSKLATENNSHADEYPMCYEIEAEIITEEPVAALDEQPDGSVVCTKYRSVGDYTQPDPLQMELF